MRARMSFGTPLERCNSASISKTYDLKQLSNLSGGNGSSDPRAYAPHSRRLLDSRS
jgi:hypothetical protein